MVGPLGIHPAVEALLGRREEGEAARPIRARDDGHLRDEVVVRDHTAHQRVAGLVVPAMEGVTRVLENLIN